MRALLTSYLLSFDDRPFGEFVPGTNAAPPHPDVIQYIRNIQYALAHGATLDKGTIICEGNCITTPPASMDQVPKEADSPILGINQDPRFCNVILSGNAENIMVYDMSGRLLIYGDIGSGPIFSIDKSTLPSGFYLLAVMINDQVHTRKIVL